MSEDKGQKNWFVRHKIITGVIILFVLLSVIGALSDTDSTATKTVASPTNEEAKAEPAPAPEVIKVTAVAMYADYEANEVAADQKYEGKEIEVTGTISTIGKDIMDEPYVALKTNSPIFTVQCMFDKSNADALVTLKENQVITLRGKSAGALGNALIRNCQIVTK